jgi:hypothetical protein
MAESQATHKLHDINDLAVYVMQSAGVILSEAKDLRSSSQLPETKPTAVILRAVCPERTERAQDDSGKDFGHHRSH